MSLLSDFRDRCAPLLVPTQVTLELTYRCNERCSHCYLATYDDAADGRPPLSLAEWKRVLDELAEARALLLVLIGGEATIHPDFWEISQHAAERNFALTLISNGTRLDEHAAQRIAKLGFYQVTLSVYSIDPSIHDGMTRRPGSHALVLRAIERLRASGVSVGINCLLTRSNIDRCFELWEWARSRGIECQFDPMVTPRADGSLGPTGTRATGEQLLRYYRGMKALGRGPTPQPVEDAEAPVCNAGRGKCAISPYGDLLTCLEVREPIGNLREHSFQVLWRSEKADRLRGYRNRDLKFDASCGNGAFCDHCPGLAGAEAGDRMAPVPFLMDLAAIKRQVFEEK